MKNLCKKKDKIINGINSLEYLRQIVITKNKLADIILEETVAEHWVKIKESVLKFMNLLPFLKKNITNNNIKILIVYI